MLDALPVAGKTEYASCQGSFFFKLAQEHRNSPAMHRVLTLMRIWGARTVVLEELEPCPELEEERKAFARHYDRSKADGTGRPIRKLARLEAERLSFFRASPGQVKRHTLPAAASFLASVVIVKLHWLGEHPTKPPTTAFIYEAGLRLPGPPNAIEPSRRSSPPTWPTHVHARLGSHFLHSSARLRARVGRPDWSFDFDGAFFCEANYEEEYYVCRHAAMRMLLRNHVGRKTFAAIEKKLARAKRERLGLPGERDVTKTIDVFNALRYFGLQPTIADLEARITPENHDYAHVLHSMLEPGKGALLTMNRDPGEGNLHMFPVVGHTLNVHSWFPMAEHAYSDLRGIAPSLNTYLWADNFIVHDNNLGPLLEMRQDVLRKTTLPWCDPGMRVLSLIGILPRRVGSTAYSAETLALNLMLPLTRQLKDHFEKTHVVERWFNEFASVLHYLIERRRQVPPNERLSGRAGFVALRTVLVDRDDYLTHVRTVSDREGGKMQPELFDKISAFLPSGQWWMVEFTDPDIFSGNGSRYAEVLLPSRYAGDLKDYEEHKRSARHLVRIPGRVALPILGHPGDYRVLNCDIKGYVPLITR